MTDDQQHRPSRRGEEIGQRTYNQKEPDTNEVPQPQSTATVCEQKGAPYKHIESQ